MKKNNFLILICFVLIGCKTAPDGWHYRASNPGTSNQYIKGNYIISCNYNHFVLFEHGEKINEFKTLNEAKKFVENH